MAVGSVLAMTVNNLPVVASSVRRGSRARILRPIIAFLIGTNIAAIATPHGSVATILARSVGARHDVDHRSRRQLGFAAIRGRGRRTAACSALYANR